MNCLEFGNPGLIGTDIILSLITLTAVYPKEQSAWQWQEFLFHISKGA